MTDNSGVEAPIIMQPQKKDNWYKRLNKKQKIWFWIGIAIVIAIIAGVIVVFAKNKPSPVAVATPTPSPTPTIPPYSNLDGELTTAAGAIIHPLAVMIENTPDARPQSGLSQAAIVYDAIAEGGITRFMAVFGPQQPAKVGPVRSARPYYVDIAEEFQPNSAYYAHVGGSNDALNKIKGDKVLNLDQFSIGSAAYQRIAKAGVAIEHTMYGYPSKLYTAAAKLHYPTTSTFRSWLFKVDADTANRGTAETVLIPYENSTYSVKYVYDPTNNDYVRSTAGVANADANNGRPVTPKNVIVQFVSYQTLDAKGHQGVGDEGTGTGKAFIDGKETDITWQKDHANTRTIYTNTSTGQELQFNRGQIFVELVPIGEKVTVQ